MVYVLAVISPGFYPQAKHTEAFRFLVYLKLFTVVQVFRDLGIQNFMTNTWIIDNRVNILYWKDISLKTPLRISAFNKAFQIKNSANEQWTIWSLKLKWSNVVVVSHAKLWRPSLGSSITCFLFMPRKECWRVTVPTACMVNRFAFLNPCIYSWCVLAFPFSVCQGGKWLPTLSDLR